MGPTGSGCRPADHHLTNPALAVSRAPAVPGPDDNDSTAAGGCAVGGDIGQRHRRHAGQPIAAGRRGGHGRRDGGALAPGPALPHGPWPRLPRLFAGAILMPAAAYTVTFTAEGFWYRPHINVNDTPTAVRNSGQPRFWQYGWLTG